ncbi:flagellar protein FlaG [Jeotgalibacillus alimentarius]|uniref:Flagellar protein FlaG n=1 Tax=Jeotgalibacillus alimentarius TaxID=135826 RepID=A0A0C2R8M0_9BACL|nr:flagellar protein FlaG [Jeotgalibacillus alimentarius]KIL46580.1 flagellar protein FlaG [Jeotgalibacillus alimentarius]
MNRIGEATSSSSIQESKYSSLSVQRGSHEPEASSIQPKIHREEPLSQAEILKAVQGMNDFLKPTNSHLKFEFHEDLGEYYVTVVDEITKEVIKEIPSKKLLDSYAAMTEYLGILMDHKV